MNHYWRLTWPSELYIPRFQTHLESLYPNTGKKWTVGLGVFLDRDAKVGRQRLD